MNKKIGIAAVLAMLLSTSAFAADTILEKTNAMEKTIYGKVQEGAIVDRAGQLELTLQGHEDNEQVAALVNRLYKEVESNGHTPTLKTTTNILQWTYNGEVTEAPLIEKLDVLERAILGRVSKDPLEERVSNMKEVLLGSDKDLVYQEVAVPSSTVFKVKLDEPISTEHNEEGDTFSFTVAEDIVADDLLVVPEGTKGQGVITKLKKAKSFGRPAEIDLSFMNIPTVSEDTFSALQGEEAKERTETEIHAAGASVAGVAILGPIGVVGGFFIKGHDIEYPKGQAMFVQPTQEVITYGLGLEDKPEEVVEEVVEKVNNDSNDAKSEVGEVENVNTDDESEEATVEISKKDDTDDEVIVSEDDNDDSEIIEDDSTPERAVIVIRKSE